MNDFHYRRSTLLAEGVPLEKIAKDVGTPTYVYTQSTLLRHFGALTQAFEGHQHLMCYSVKANSNLALLKLFGSAGSGFDIVSQGELERVLRVTRSPSRIVFSGVGKTSEEMAAAHRAGILLFNVESGEELEALDRVGRSARRPAPFAIRVNPNVDARTHRYIATGLKTSKFGVPLGQARELYARSRRMKGVVARGVDCHIGSQLTDAAPVQAAMSKIAAFYKSLTAEGFRLRYLDVGGGLGITYRDETPPTPLEYAAIVLREVKGTGASLILEPGRLLVGNAGVLLTQVLYRKSTRYKTFVIVDGGMNDLLRPALYDAHHRILPARKRAGRLVTTDIVGPVCESADVLGRARRLVLPRRGDLLAIMSAGAYGMTMASNYNSRPRPAEVMVDGSTFRIIRNRETSPDLWRGERA